MAENESIQETQVVRADVWLWAVRLFKSRSLAASACRKGQVKVEGNVIKASRLLRVGDVVEVERQYLVLQIRLLQLLQQRVGAKAVAAYAEDITSDEEREKAKRLAAQNRPVIAEKGKGRPTKKNRRLREQWEEEGLLIPMDDESLKEVWSGKKVRREGS